MTGPGNKRVVIRDGNAVGRSGKTDAPDESWRAIPGLEGLYEVSSCGRIHSLPRVVLRRGKQMRVPGGIVRTPPDSNGYPRFNACKNGVPFRISVHQAVAAAFIGPLPPGLEVRHLNGKPMDNSVGNIAYGTRAQNIADAKAHGTFPLLEHRPGAVLNRDQARAIAASTEVATMQAIRYGVSAAAIRQIRNGRTWSSVTEGARRSSYRIRGSSVSNALLTESLVAEIIKSTESRRAIAARLGVSPATIKSVRTGRAWKHVARA